MAISAGVASAARSGILISDGGAFELLKKVRCMAFDKTGTVTDASFNVRRTIGGGENEFSLLAALERRSGHPIAKAITAHFASNPAHDGAVTNFRTEEGIGIAGSVGIIDVFAGNEKAVINAGLALTAEQAAFMSECTSNGLTVIFWGIAGSKVLGGVALGDQIRPEAKGVIASLQQMGISAELLSGDSVTTTAYVADQLSITRYLGAASPPDKAHVVKSLKESGGNVCMVGDGVNDAPALAEADIGIALASGTDIAARTAQVTLLTPDMTLLPKLIHLSRRTVGIMNLNLFWAFLYNVVCIPLAMLGKVTPIWAVSAMLISSLTVILNTQRLKKN
jgi:Cu+-exporting ATPase